MRKFIDRFKIPVTWILRVLTGSLFIFSGFVKGIDPWGTLYKFQEYCSVWHIEVWPNLLVLGVFILCIYEFLTGIFLISGSFRKSSPIMGLLMMAFMLPLTVWIAFSNPVPDCGCFGDALIISNWLTLWKNVVITAMLVWLVIYNRCARCLIRPSMQWIAFVVSSLYLLAVAEFGYISQPLIDFRPYAEGKPLVDYDDYTSETGDDESDNIRFIYTKDGVEKSFGIDDELPDDDSGWEFVRREEATPTAVSPAYKGNVHSQSTFRVWSEDGDTDLTDEAIPQQGSEMILLMPEPGSVSIASTWKINSLMRWADNHSISFIAVMAANEEEIANWKDISLADYPIYTAEDTQIKILARGNPAVVYVKDGKVVWKRSLRSLPDDDFQIDDADAAPESFRLDNTRILLNITGIYLVIMIALGFISYAPAFFTMLGRYF